jgi:hypothetical protein
MAATIQQAGSLFNIALKSADSITAGERDGHQQTALVSLVFAVVSLEAFFNETVELANMTLVSEQAFLSNGVVPKYLEPDVVSVFFQLMTDAEKSRASLESKFLLANWLLTGKGLDKGAQPYQDFALLLKVRNQLVHFKPNDIFTEPEVTPEMLSSSRNPVVEQLRSRNVLATNIVGLTGWTAWIETKAMAKWSCDVASRMVVDFVGKTPVEGQWGHFLRFMQRSFTLEVNTAEVSKTSPPTISSVERQDK